MVRSAQREAGASCQSPVLRGSQKDKDFFIGGRRSNGDPPSFDFGATSPPPSDFGAIRLRLNFGATSKTFGLVRVVNTQKRTHFRTKTPHVPSEGGDQTDQTFLSCTFRGNIFYFKKQSNRERAAALWRMIE
jgi:hypothetical protein